MSTYRKLMTVGCAAVLALGLAACGNGDDDTTMDDGMEMPMPDPAIAERGAISSAITTATTAVGAVNDESSDDDVAAADTAVAAAKMAIADAAHVPAEEKAANSGTVSVLEGNLASAKASRTKAIADAAEAVRLAAEAAARAVATKAAGTKLKAMQTEAGRAAATTDEGLGGHANDAAAETAYTLSIKRDRSDTTIEIKDPARAAMTDPKFELAEDMGDGRQMFVLKNDADADGDVVEEVVIVGTDIKIPSATGFEKVYPLDVREDGETVNTNNPADTLDLGTALVSTDDAQAMVLARVMSSGFVAGAGTTTELTFDADDDATNDKDETAEVDGTYDGAMGTYRCGGDTDCTVTLTRAMGKVSITAMSDGWTFTPDADETVDVPDANFLNYGFWLKKTTDEDGELTYNEVETFAGASAGLPASGSVGDVTGSASYDGEAVGVYVHHVLSEGGGEVDSSTSGHFKADASLTATFGQPAAPNNSIPPNQLDTITGTIDNFTLSGGETQDWSVNLARSTVSESGTHTGMAEGGGASGSYSATFHGSVAEVDDVVPQPSAVVGEFNANMSNGSVAGAFGANKQ